MNSSAGNDRQLLAAAFLAGSTSVGYAGRSTAG
jgi:hypothetical protein